MMPEPQQFSTRSTAGTTLLELAIALFISSIVILGAFQAYRYTINSATREKRKAELQSDIITFSNIIEKDIRMAGCGLPGNGLYANLSNPSAPQLQMYSNENGYETSLTENLQPAHNKAIVADTAGFVVRGGICIAENGVDTIYRTVTGIGVCDVGPDTIHFNPTAGTATLFQPGNARVYPARVIGYSISGSPPDRKIYRRRNSQNVPLGGDIDSVYITAKNSSGASVGGSIKDASVLTVVMGGFIGSGGNRVFLADSTEINMRNRN